MIASFYDGRIRIRAKALKDPDKMEMITGLVKSQDGVREAVANSRTGSLLVQYDPEKVSREQLFQAASMLEDHLGVPSKDSVSCAGRVKLLSRRQESALLAAVYGATALSGFLNKRAHIAAGVLFTILAGMHLYARRRCL